MTGSYYFWKWADNDLPGRPVEVHAALLRGELHPALQTFDARPLLRKLGSVARVERRRGAEWEWEVTPRAAPERARFVFVTCPAFNTSPERAEWFGNNFLPLELSEIEDGYGRTIPCLRPKLSQFIPLQSPEETAYDISPEDLPVLLREMIVSGFPGASAELLDRNGGVVAIAKGRRFCVEWREYANWKKPAEFQQWRAQDPKRLEALGGAIPEASLPFSRDPDYLLLADALRIFESFLRGEPRPARYGWSEVHDFD